MAKCTPTETISSTSTEASAIGWKTYINGDNAKANALIKRDNPDMTDEQIAFSIAKMKEYGIVDSGDALTGGDLGWRSMSRLPQLFLDATEKLNVGEVSAIARSASSDWSRHGLKFTRMNCFATGNFWIKDVSLLPSNRCSN